MSLQARYFIFLSQVVFVTYRQNLSTLMCCAACPCRWRVLEKNGISKEHMESWEQPITGISMMCSIFLFGQLVVPTALFFGDCSWLWSHNLPNLRVYHLSVGKR
eukprot:GHUV01012964.1.p1 GENE.GHUV01012964.1~~GHUV01012964.1.p1  ORF type:complete len:104 (-),score=12.34 GHUV01012964.1:620-931(-)